MQFVSANPRNSAENMVSEALGPHYYYVSTYRGLSCKEREKDDVKKQRRTSPWGRNNEKAHYLTNSSRQISYKKGK